MNFKPVFAVVFLSAARSTPRIFRLLQAIVTHPDFRANVGNQIADDYASRIAMQTQAYHDGGWDGSVTAGVDY